MFYVPSVGEDFAFLAGALIIVGEPELGVVMPEHGALFEGVLHRALVVRVGLLKHVVKEPRASGEASGIFVTCGRD